MKLCLAIAGVGQSQKCETPDVWDESDTKYFQGTTAARRISEIPFGVKHNGRQIRVCEVAAIQAHGAHGFKV